MPQVINTNVASLNAQRNLNKSQEMMNQVMARLSSGLRINSAKDDAAGMAISDRFTSQIKGINQATRNANDGISMSQVAEGAMGEMNTNLQRLRELSIQSANATNSASDRKALNEEAQQLIAEIGRISEQTEFNGTKLLDGTMDKQIFQIGANAGQTFEMSIGKMSTDKLGGGEAATASAVGSDNALASGDLLINGVAISGSSASDDTASTDAAASSSIAKVAAINKHTAETGVVATVNATVAAGSKQELPSSATNGTITINGVTTENIGIGAGDAEGNRKAVIEAVNAISGETGVTAVDTGRAETGINLVAADGRNIEISFDTLTSANTGVAAADTYEGGYNLRSVDSTPISITAGTGDIANAGLAEGVYQANTATVSSLTRQSDSAFVGTGDISSGADLSGANAHTFDISLSGGDAVTVVLDTDMSADQTDLVDGLQTAIDDAIGSGIVTVGFSDDTGDDAIKHLTLMSNERVEITNVGAIDGGTDDALLTALEGAEFGGPDALREGDLVINGVAIQAAKASDDTFSNSDAVSSNKAASGIAVAAAINASSAETGVTATVQATEVDGGSGTASTATDRAGVQGAVYINGGVFSMTLTDDAEKDRATALAEINAISGKTGVTAEDTGTGLKLTAADGRNISIVIDTNAEANAGSLSDGGLNKSIDFSGVEIGLDASQDGIVEYDVTAMLNGVVTGNSTVTPLDIEASDYTELANRLATTTTSKVTLSAAGQFTVAAGQNGSAELEAMGFQVGTFGGTDGGQFLKDIDISTVEGATKALEAVDNALSTINSERGNLGAVQNRLTSTISALSITSENLSASRSRIQDADFAAETAQLSKLQVMQQAGVAMLSQANASTQNVLSLLR
ncbi:Flagellin 2 [Thiorhodovibrio winogradskyi]|uniref:Flagellin n=1 Tax=Thiorhodovibrio winogradskyi TaxID=77007 RepID=A0ABZ0SC28_9GAMM|nr:flagellin [Thiorhodovibrio winogradskyi]